MKLQNIKKKMKINKITEYNRITKYFNHCRFSAFKSCLGKKKIIQHERGNLFQTFQLGIIKFFTLHFTNLLRQKCIIRLYLKHLKRDMIACASSLLKMMLLKFAMEIILVLYSWNFFFFFNSLYWYHCIYTIPTGNIRLHWVFNIDFAQVLGEYHLSLVSRPETTDLYVARIFD